MATQWHVIPQQFHKFAAHPVEHYLPKHHWRRNNSGNPRCKQTKVLKNAAGMKAITTTAKDGKKHTTIHLFS